MTMVYTSTVIDAPVDKVWALVRNFDAPQQWFLRDPPMQMTIEDGAAPDQVSAVRVVSAGGEVRGKERLVAHSDLDRTFTYQFAEDIPGYDLRDYTATIRVRPITDGDRTFFEWFATFDCDEAVLEKWTHNFRDVVFTAGCASLKAHFSS
jgi:hypothetical protein